MEGGHCVRTVHAEANLVATAARYGISLDGATVYVYVKNGDTTMRGVCRGCEMLMQSAGISEWSVDSE
jgi:dCMP deaminase